MNIKNVINKMATKEELINFFIEGLKESFVNKYEEINNSKDIVNSYMKEINFNFEYDYNTFCTEFIKHTTDKLENIDESEYTNLDINIIISEVLINMIKLKIFNTVKDEKERTTLMMIHELKKYLMKKPK